MNVSLTYLDMPLLIGRGFTFGITDEVLWGRDKDGDEWQVVAQEKFMQFAKRIPGEYCLLEGQRTMKRSDFEELFPL